MNTLRIWVAGLVMALLMATTLSVGADNHTPTIQVRTITLPVGAIVAFQSACPADGNWDRLEAASGRFLLGAGHITGTELNVPPSTAAGEARHGHSVGDSSTNIRKDDDGSDSEVARPGHRHAVGESLNIPPYYSVVFCILK